MTLDDEIAATLKAVEGCIQRLRAVHTIRASEGKSIAPGRAADARRLSAALDTLILELPAPADAVNELFEKLRSVL